MSPARGSGALPPPAPNKSMVRFLASLSFWVIALFGAFRLPWLQANLLVPFAAFQQRIAVALFGVSSRAVIVDISCTGSDAMAICFGAILGFPAPLTSRLRAVGLGFLLITALNIVRIATVSAVVGDPDLFEMLHVYVWPGVIVLVAVLYVFWWMKAETPGAGSMPGSGPTAGGPESATGSRPVDDAAQPSGEAGAATIAWGIAGSPTARFIAVVTGFVGVYLAATPWLLTSSVLQRGAEWAAGIARTIMSGLGVPAQVNGAVLMTGGGGWIVTPECIVTPLIPVYAATALCWPGPALRRAAVLALGVPVFMFLGVARLLVLAVPASMPVQTVMVHGFYQFLVAALLIVIAVRHGSGDDAGGERWWGEAIRCALVGAGAALGYALLSFPLLRVVRSIEAGMPHVGHGYADPQGALMILPAFQAGLFVALWSASGRSLRRAPVAVGLVALAMQQVVIAVLLGEVFVHAGAEAPIAAIRLLAVGVPPALVWALGHRRSSPRGLLPSATAARPG